MPPSRPAVQLSGRPFSAVLEEHGPSLLRFCVSQAGPDRGEDVFQETMLAALRAYASVRDPTAVRSWLFSIATRKAVDAHRVAARSPVPVAEPEPHAPSATTDSGHDEVWEHVARLPEKQRLAVALRYLADLSHQEIAVAMEISPAAARRNVFEALRRLRGELDPADPTDLTEATPPSKEGVR